MSDWRFMSLFPEEDFISKAIICITKGEERLRELNREVVDLFEYARSIQEQDPEAVKDIFKKMEAGYNEELDKLINKFPLTTDSCWQIYRRTNSKFSLPESFPENDETMSKFYMDFAREIPPTSMDAEPEYILLDKKQRFQGIDSYTFKKGEKGIALDTIWDLRQKQIPRFQYKE
jgi:hypothetical protein